MTTLDNYLNDSLQRFLGAGAAPTEIGVPEEEQVGALSCVRGAYRHPRRVWKEAERSWPAGKTWGSVTTPDPLWLRMFSGRAHFPWASRPGDRPILKAPQVSGLHRVCVLWESAMIFQVAHGQSLRSSISRSFLVKESGHWSFLAPFPPPTSPILQGKGLLSSIPVRTQTTVLAESLPSRQRDRPSGLCSCTFISSQGRTSDGITDVRMF